MNNEKVLEDSDYRKRMMKRNLKIMSLAKFVLLVVIIFGLFFIPYGVLLGVACGLLTMIVISISAGFNPLFLVNKLFAKPENQ